MNEEFPAQKLLQEFDAEEGRLDLLALQVPADENRKIRDEILSLACGAKVNFQFIEADTIRTQIMNSENTQTLPEINEKLVRKFEDAGWRWG